MNRMLLIYDLEGNILTVKSEESNEPVGVPYLWVELNSDKFIDFNKKVNVENEEHTFELSDVPTSEIDLLKAKVEYQEELSSELESALYDVAELLETVLSGGNK